MSNMRCIVGRARLWWGGAGTLVAIAGLTGAAAAAGPVEVIYTKKAGDPKAVVPGAVDLSGNPETVEWKAMEGFVLSPDGTRWILRARTTATEDHDTGIVLGSGTGGAMFTVNTAGGPVVIQEGRPAPFGNTADWIDFMPTGFGRFDDNNKLVFGIRARPNQAVGGTSADANRVIKWDGAGGAATLAFKQGDLYFDMIDLPPNPSGDETVGNSVGSYHLLNDGRVGSQDSTILNVHTSHRPAITYDREMFHQTGVTTVPMGAFGVGQMTWATIDANEFYTTADGQHWYGQGRVLGATTADDGVLSYDGTVVLREGWAIPGTSVLVGDFFQTFLAGNGDWVARGRDNSGTAAAAPDWAVKNGALIARTGDTVAPGENWGDTFYAVTANRVGDWVLAGNTNNSDLSRDNVVVLNGQVVLREGDPVDLNGNGQFDDDAFIGRGVNTNAAFNANTWFLTDELVLHGIVMLRNGAGQDLTSNPVFGTPQALIRIDLGPGCYPDCNASGTLTIADFICFQGEFVAGNLAYADCNNNGTLTIADFICFQGEFVTGCP